MSLCECGCGGVARKRFIQGHHTRVKPPRQIDPIYEVRDCGYTTPCWVCLYKDHNAGYRKITVNGVQDYAHRHFFREHKGEIPPGKQIDHLCRNRGCINPDHLEAVSPAENTRRGRGTKLTLSDAQEIRSLDGTYHEIAARFGIAPCSVGQIKRGVSWKAAA